MKSPLRQRMRYVARLHFWVMFFAFFGYLALGFTLGPKFFAKDILQKIHALADDTIVITATVLGGPAMPGVTATPVCVSGAPRINLDWADNAATTAWDVERDSLPLTTGLTTSAYIDTAVVANTAYSYVVTAYGPMSPGSVVSSTVVATALDCPNILPSATVTIETLGDANVSINRTGITLERRRPKVTGTTNIANAIIEIVVTNPSIHALLTANANGYFSWVPSVRLNSGNHILSVTATDPSDSSRSALDTFVFRTKNDGGGGAGNEEETPGIPSTFDFSVRVNNAGGLLYQGDRLSVTARTKEGAFPAESILEPSLLNVAGEELLRLPDMTANPTRTEFLFEQDIPLTFDPGEYRVRVDALLGHRVVSREASLSVRAWPLVDLGGGRIITYPEIVSLVGWIFYISFLLLLLFLLLFVREYWFYLHSIRHITERHLARLGFLGLGKGVKK
ncbi:MAG: hypothetical protein ABI747_00095 [Candidatus Moraniibacteriota bacterium]